MAHKTNLKKKWDSITQKWSKETYDAFLTFSVNDNFKRRLIEHVQALHDQVIAAKATKWFFGFNKEESLVNAECVIYMYLNNMPKGSNTTEKLKKEFTPYAKDLLLYLKRDL